MSFKWTSKCQRTPKRKFYCCSACGAISFILTIFYVLALAFNLTDELFFLVIKKVTMQLVKYVTTYITFT